MNALLMKQGAQDFKSGQKFDHTVFFGENVDIHHVFPQKWCKEQRIEAAVYDSIINKTPLSYHTNRVIGGAAPSDYLGKLEKGDRKLPAISRDRLDDYLKSHLIHPEYLRSDDFATFMAHRQQQLLKLIEAAMGKPAHGGASDETEVEADEETIEAEHTIAAE